MLTEELTASTQYQDVCGTIAADGHDGALLHDIAEACKIDTERYFPLRFSIGLSERSIEGLVLVSFYVFDLKLAKDEGFKTLWEYAEAHEHRVPVKCLEGGEVSVGELFCRCNRLQIVGESKSLSNGKLTIYEEKEKV